jgi:hypothetical protein
VQSFDGNRNAESIGDYGGAASECQRNESAARSGESRVEAASPDVMTVQILAFVSPTSVFSGVRAWL